MAQPSVAAATPAEYLSGCSHSQGVLGASSQAHHLHTYRSRIYSHLASRFLCDAYSRCWSSLLCHLLEQPLYVSLQLKKINRWTSQTDTSCCTVHSAADMDAWSQVVLQSAAHNCTAASMFHARSPSKKMLDGMCLLNKVRKSIASIQCYLEMLQLIEECLHRSLLCSQAPVALDCCGHRPKHHLSE